jgi:cytochrome c553
VSRLTVSLALFFGIISMLIVWGMQTNGFERTSVHRCTGPCYEDWVAETGGVVAIAQNAALERASASPAELGEKAYTGCVACHGARGEGGIGPALAGQTEEAIAGKLLAYRNGETLGPQSVLMWSQAKPLSDDDIAHLAAFAATL